MTTRRGFTGVEILVALTVLGVLGGGVVAAADRSKPGDLLFPLDRAVEVLRERTASDPVRQFELRVKHAKERARELSQLEKENESSPTKQTAERVVQAAKLTTQALQQAQQTVSTLSERIPASEQSRAQESLQKVLTLLQSLQQVQQETSQRVSKLKAEVEDNETKQKLESVDVNGSRQVLKTEVEIDPETGEIKRRVKVYRINPDGTETKVLDVEEKRGGGQTKIRMRSGEESKEGEVEPSKTPEPTENSELSEIPELSETPEANEVPELSEASEPSEVPEPSETPKPSESREATEFHPTKAKEQTETREVETVEIKWKEGAFEDANRVIHVGDSVRWKNEERQPLRVVSDDLPGLDSGTLQKGQEYEYFFVSPGSYGYRNQLSPGSGGTITVK